MRLLSLNLMSRGRTLLVVLMVLGIGPSFLRGQGHGSQSSDRGGGDGSPQARGKEDGWADAGVSKKRMLGRLGRTGVGQLGRQ